MDGVPLDAEEPALLNHLLASLAAFFEEHERCGDLNGGVEGERVWMTCTCGVTISRTLEPSHRQ
jgi:hypothetical protein